MTMLAQLPAFEDLVTCDCPYTLAVGIVIFQALVFGSITSYVAVHRGLNAGRWFFVGFAFSFLGMLWVCTRLPIPGRFSPRPFGKTPCTYDPIRCDACGAWVHPSRHTCVKCGQALPGEHPQSEVESAIGPAEGG